LVAKETRGNNANDTLVMAPLMKDTAVTRWLEPYPKAAVAPIISKKISVRIGVSVAQLNL